MSNFYHRLQVRFNEVDMHQHVYFVNYLTYFEIAMTEFLKHTGINPKMPGNLAIYVKHIAIDYYQPLYFDQVINICVDSAKMGESSLTFGLSILTEDFAKKCAMGEVVWICVDTHSGKKSGWPDELREIFISFNR